MKKCKACGIKKPETGKYYHRQRSTLSGFRPTCKKCRSIDSKKERKKTMINEPERFIWSAMKQRCINPKNNKYDIYGGRGITVSDRWLNSYDNFIRDMGKRPTNSHTIDRIDNDGNYEKANCRWATYVEQNKNRRTNKNNTSGKTGVVWEKRTKKWYAELIYNHTRYRLGYHQHYEEAVKARIEAENKYHNL